MNRWFFSTRSLPAWALLLIGLAGTALVGDALRIAAAHHIAGDSNAAIDYVPVWAGVATGLIITGLMFWLALLLASGRERAVQIAAQLTAQVRQHETQLRDSEQRLNLALEGAGLSVWEWSIPDRRVSYATRWRHLIGFDRDGMGESLDQWLALMHPDDLPSALAAIETCQRDGADHLRFEYRLRGVDGSYLWVAARGTVIERDVDRKPLRMTGVSADISKARQSQQRIETLNRLYAALSACNSAIVRCKTPDDLFAEICQMVVAHGGVKMAWVGLTDAPTGRILPVASAGEGTGYLDGIEISVSADDPHGLGPTGTAVRENRPVWFSDFANNPLTAPWRERAAAHGWQQSAAVPLCRHGKPVGALTFYSVGMDWQDEETRRLFDEVAADISFALDKLDAEAAARIHQATLIEAEQRFSAMIEQSIAGAFIAQDGALSYVNPRLCSILGYADDSALLGRTPQELVAPADRGRVEEQLAGVMTGGLSHQHMIFTARRADGGTVDVAIDFSLTHYQMHPALVGLVQDLSDREVAERHIRRYADQIESMFKQTVRLVTTLGELRDPYTVGHEQRVADLAVAIGTQMGLGAQVLEGLDVGGQLHDVGKMQVPAEILSKPGRLSDAEYALIQGHSRAGYAVLKDVQFPWPVAQIALQHHERMDGSGYPQGLKGDQIMLEARIVAVADVVEAMASHRPYRAGMGVDLALAEIERGAGTVYDTEVAKACLRLFREKGYTLSAIT